MKKFYLILPIMIFVLGCSQNTDTGVGLNILMHNLGGSGSRAIDSQDLTLIDKVEVWVLPEGFKNNLNGSSMPTMNPSISAFKTPGSTEYTAEELAIGYIELEVDVETIVNIWIRVDTKLDEITQLEKIYVGTKRLYVSPNTSAVKVDVYETDISLLNSDGFDWNEYINNNF